MTDKFWTKERLDAAIEMRSAGKSYAEIGAALGCSYKSVSSKMDRVRHATPPRPRKDAWAPEEKATLIEHRRAGLSYAAIGELMGRSTNAVSVHARRKMDIGIVAPAAKETFWTPERVSALRIAAENHTPARDIATALGCTRMAVLGKCDRLGLSVQKPRRKAAPIEASVKKLFAPNPDLWIEQTDLDRLFDLGPVIDISESVESPPSDGVPIWDLKNRHCRYTLNYPCDTEDLRYCGGQIVKGGPWCATHHKICCTPFPARKSVERSYR